MYMFSDMPLFVQEVYEEQDAMWMDCIDMISVCDYHNPAVQYWHDVVGSLSTFRDGIRMSNEWALEQDLNAQDVIDDLKLADDIMAHAKSIGYTFNIKTGKVYTKCHRYGLIGKRGCLLTKTFSWKDGWSYRYVSVVML